MKKIGFITANKVLAQSLAALLKSNPSLGFEPFLLLDFRQALLDAEILRIDVAVIDMIEEISEDTEKICSFIERMHQISPDCRLMLLVSKDNEEWRKTAVNAMKRKIVDDFVFYDTSLDYLFAKLAAI